MKRPKRGRLRDKEDRTLSPYARKGKRPYRYDSGEGSPALDIGPGRRKPRFTKQDAWRPFARTR